MTFQWPFVVQSSLVQNQIADATTKVGQPKLAIIRIQNMLIPLPPLSEQKSIVAKLEEIRKANCIIAVAGMEGALGGVLAGLVEVPVIAVPTSIGYGANFGGLSALLTMLNSCSNGITVVNIDNGYGAGYISTQINRLAVKAYKPE